MGNADDSDKLEDAHNRGQEDAAKGEYNPPIGVWVPLGVTDEEIAESEAYDKGYNNHWDQTHPGCFLTTACVEAAGLSDGCRELTTLRQFRDRVLFASPQGRVLIRRYYQLAPAILEALHDRADRPELLNEVLLQVRKAVAHVERGEFPEALGTYAGMVSRLSDVVRVSRL